jgi:hypothetical protein
MRPASIGLLIIYSAICSAEDRRIAAIDHSVMIAQDFSQQPLPVFRGGYLIARSRTPPGFSIWDRSGRMVAHRDLTLPGAAVTSINDIAATSRGDVLALAVSATNTDAKSLPRLCGPR